MGVHVRGRWLMEMHGSRYPELECTRIHAICIKRHTKPVDQLVGSMVTSQACAKMYVY